MIGELIQIIENSKIKLFEIQEIDVNKEYIEYEIDILSIKYHLDKKDIKKYILFKTENIEYLKREIQKINRKEYIESIKETISIIKLYQLLKNEILTFKEFQEIIEEKQLYEKIIKEMNKEMEEYLIKNGLLTDKYLNFIEKEETFIKIIQNKKQIKEKDILKYLNIQFKDLNKRNECIVELQSRMKNEIELNDELLKYYKNENLIEFLKKYENEKLKNILKIDRAIEYQDKELFILLFELNRKCLNFEIFFKEIKQYPNIKFIKEIILNEINDYTIDEMKIIKKEYLEMNSKLKEKEMNEIYEKEIEIYLKEFQETKEIPENIIKLSKTNHLIEKQKYMKFLFYLNKNGNQEFLNKLKEMNKEYINDIFIQYLNDIKKEKSLMKPDYFIQFLLEKNSKEELKYLMNEIFIHLDLLDSFQIECLSCIIYHLNLSEFHLFFLKNLNSNYIQFFISLLNYYFINNSFLLPYPLDLLIQFLLLKLDSKNQYFKIIHNLFQKFQFQKLNLNQFIEFELNFIDDYSLSFDYFYKIFQNLDSNLNLKLFLKYSKNIKLPFILIHFINDFEFKDLLNYSKEELDLLFQILNLFHPRLFHLNQIKEIQIFIESNRDIFPLPNSMIIFLNYFFKFHKIEYHYSNYKIHLLFYILKFKFNENEFDLYYKYYNEYKNDFILLLNLSIDSESIQDFMMNKFIKFLTDINEIKNQFKLIIHSLSIHIYKFLNYFHLESLNLNDLTFFQLNDKEIDFLLLFSKRILELYPNIIFEFKNYQNFHFKLLFSKRIHCILFFKFLFSLGLKWFKNIKDLKDLFIDYYQILLEMSELNVNIKSHYLMMAQEFYKLILNE